VTRRCITDPKCFPRTCAVASRFNRTDSSCLGNFLEIRTKLSEDDSRYEVIHGCESQSSKNNTLSDSQKPPDGQNMENLKDEWTPENQFKNSGRDLRPKCRECLKLSVRTFLANIDPRTQPRPPWEFLSNVTLVRISASFPHQDDRNQTIRCQSVSRGRVPVAMSRSREQPGNLNKRYL
jgi:hypothetical protein